MKWFYNLKRAYRIIIAIVAWLPLFVCAVVFSSNGASSEDMPPWQTLLILAFFVVGMVFTIFAIIASVKEKKAAKADLARQLAEIKAKEDKEKAEILNNTISNADVSELVKIGDVAYFSDEPIFVTKLIKNTNEEMQDNLSAINIDDDVALDYDYEKMLYECIVDYNTIGYLPEKIGDKLEGKFCIKVTDIYENDNDKYIVEVSIYPSCYIEFPLYTKAVGVTFDNRQECLKESKDGDELIIQHAPSDKYPQAVEIINRRTSKQLGHIKADLAKSMCEQFGDGFILYGVIDELTGGTDELKTCGCNIKILGKKE